MAQIAQLEELVNTIYSPQSSPELIHQAQRELQLEQKSANGWQLAHSLLSSSNSQAQFLGAQTFIVKLNNGSHLPPVDVQEQDLLTWLVRARDSGFATFVTRKILGAITKLYFMNNEWRNAPFSVIEILGPGSAICFEFLNFLIEDSQLPASDLRAKLVPDISQMVYNLIRERQFTDRNAVKTFEVWSLPFFDQFKDLVPDLVSLAIELFGRCNENNSENDFVTEIRELEVAILEVLSTSYTNDWRSWPPLARRHLSEALLAVANQYMNVPPTDLMDDDVFLAMSRLVLSICQEDFETNTYLHPFLANMAGIPLQVVDDPLSAEILDFWNQYTEEVVSSALSTSSEASKVIATVITGYWPRIKLYPALRQSDWSEFSSFRKDFADFLELSYPIVGTQLFDHLTEVVISSLQEPEIDWMSIESALFCLNGLADIIGEDYRGEKVEFRSVHRIFQSELWTRLPQCEHLRVRQTAVNLIGCFVDFFLSPEGEPFLAVILNYLFTCLGTKSLQTTASRSIQKLCDVCRHKLVSEVPAFLTIYQQIKPELDTVPHVRTVGGIAYVIQCIQDLNFKANALAQLLDIVSTVNPALNTPESLLEAHQTILKCVATIGKNLQTQVPDMNSQTDGDVGAAAFWNQDQTAIGIRQKLRDIIYSGMESPDLTCIEAVCSIVKVGIAEDAGPFSLGDEFVTSFITTKAATASPVTVIPVLELARFHVMSLAARIRKTGKQFVPPATCISGLFDVSQHFSESATSAVLDVLTQMVVLSAALEVPLLDLAPNSPAAVSLAIMGLGSTDRFILRSAVAFWKEFLSTPPVHSPMNADSNGQQRTMDPTVADNLVRVLLTQISGLASRSELGSLSQVTKTLVSNHPFIASKMFKHYVVESPVERAIAQQDIKVRNTFVTQLFLVKSSKRMQEVIQKFWLTCRGIPETYDPHTFVEL